MDLTRARNTLPPEASSNDDIRDYHEYLEHNELECACDLLEEYATEYPVSKEFWLALRDAATKMQLSDNANRYVEYARSTQPGEVSTQPS